MEPALQAFRPLPGEDHATPALPEVASWIAIYEELSSVLRLVQSRLDGDPRADDFQRNLTWVEERLALWRDRHLAHHAGARRSLHVSAELVLQAALVVALWAALIARFAQSLGKSFGLIQAPLYAGVQAGHAMPGLRDITAGNNGAYAAGPGWDASTEIGRAHV